MMKKNGFTLAEVLITLAIIGVVATMTLPSLMTNTSEQQAKSALKKGINTFTEAAQMSQAVDGYDYSSLTSTDLNEDAQSLYGLLARRTAVDFTRSGDNKLVSSYGGGNYVMFFRDGSAISFKKDTTASNKSSGAKQADVIESDGLPYGMTALYDTNGIKGPNQVSNCTRTTTGLASGGKDNTAANAASVCTKANRVIKDQFGIRLRGGYAVPNGAAARWAFEN